MPCLTRLLNCQKIDGAVRVKLISSVVLEMSFTLSGQQLTATGGDTIQEIGGYRIHTFTTVGTSTFTPSRACNVEVLVVAGGGGSGGGQGGAGGGGGLIYTSIFTVPSAVPVIVGNGGAGGIDINTVGSNGGNSIFSSLTAIGGGGGGSDAGTLNGQNGGSGGGSGSEVSIGTAGTGTAGQGNNGGIASITASGYGGGGGGGAGQIGGNGTASTGGKGGDGLSFSISGSSVYYAGGGGGGIFNGNGTPGTGGLGGGGNGSGTGSGQNGTPGTGGGGGAGGTKVNGVLSNGGSGIVIVRYLINQVPQNLLLSTGTISATGGNTVQDIGGYRIHTFTTTGTQTFTVTGKQITNAQILIVAGGGGAGSGTGGGGGAGGLIYVPSTTLSTGSYTVTVGAGGAGNSSGQGGASNGGNSSFGGVGTAIGGGAGANTSGAGNGGSGGGIGNSPNFGSGTAGQGNNGGSGLQSGNYEAGGGGGAGAVGANGAVGVPGVGGIGLAYSISGTSTYYAGGGGGGWNGSATGGAGGLGGGGNGGNSANNTAGTPNTGGGGGGGNNFPNGTYANGKAGGSGIVIVAYSININSSTTGMTGTPLFSQLSANATSSAVGAFSLRAVKETTTKVVQVKRSSDNATQDFWADRLGNLVTVPMIGQTLQSWLGGSTGNVVTWYDQSGAGRNATGTQTTIVQTSNVNQQWAVNPTNGGLSLSGGTFLNGTDFTITCTTKRLGTQDNDGVYGYGANAAWVSQASVPTTYGANTRFGLVMPNAGSTDVRFNDSSFSAAFSSNANVVPSSFVAATEPTVYTAVTLTNTTQRMYINGTANGVPISTLTQLTANASTGFTIGAVDYYGNFLGEIGELLIFNNALSTSDISTIYSAR